MQAHPHSWFLVADNLHLQACQLYKNKAKSYLTRIDFSSGDSDSWDSVNRAVFLLGGFALENAIKAFLVYENPSWISNGKLSRQLRSHSLSSLAAKSHHIPYKVHGRWILRAFEEGLESWARYPCSLTNDKSDVEKVLTNRLWSGYTRLTSAYGRKLKKMLSREWVGPHGFKGRFDIDGEYLSAK